MMEMKKYKLGEILENYDNLRKPLSSKERLGFQGNYPYYGAQGIIDHVKEYRCDGEYMLIAEDGENLSSRKEPIAQIASGRFWVNNHAHIVKTNSLANINYICYLINSTDITGYVTGSTQPKLSQANLNKIEVTLPPLPVQHKIASVLSSLDRKIALNKQINQNLESLARQLYDYWFVQFDFPDANGKPYKSSGGKMVYNPILKREIPEGWEVKEIREFMRIFTGKKDVSKTIPGDYKFFSCAPEPITSNEYIYDGAAVLVSGNGSYTGRVSFYKGKMDLYQRTYACVMNDDSHMPFFYYTLRYQFQPIFTGGKHGSAIPYIVMDDLACFRFTYNELLVQIYCEKIKDLFYLQSIKKDEIENLTKQRDELLPLLMNGQVVVE